MVADLCKMNTLKLIRTLDDYLAEYETLCSQKEVKQAWHGPDEQR